MRDLPWRRTRDPWAVLVSEVMLQQTQVARVIPIWHAFMQQLPDGRRVRGGLPGRRGAGLGGLRVQPPGGQPPPRRGADARRSAARPGRVARIAGHRPLHGQSGARLRVRGGRRGRRHEHRPGVDSPRRSTAHTEAAASRGRRARSCREGVGVEPAPHGPRRARVHRPRRRPAIGAGCATGANGMASSGRLAGSRRSSGQIVRAVDGSSQRSAPGTCPCASSVS